MVTGGLNDSPQGGRNSSEATPLPSLNDIENFSGSPRDAHREWGHDTNDVGHYGSHERAEFRWPLSRRETLAAGVATLVVFATIGTHMFLNSARPASTEMDASGGVARMAGAPFKPGFAGDNSQAAVRYLRSKGNNLIPLPDVDGLKQFLTIHEGTAPQAVFISPSGHFIISGVGAIDLEGRPVTIQQIQQVIAAQGAGGLSAGTMSPQQGAGHPEAQPDEQLSSSVESVSQTAGITAAQPVHTQQIEALPPISMKRIEGANWIPFGKSGAPVLYVVADPECPFCRASWPAFQAAADSGKVEIRLVPVGLVNPKLSFAESVAIMEGDHPQALWQDAMRSRPPKPATIYQLENVDAIDARTESEAKRTGDTKSKVKMALQTEAAILTNHDILSKLPGLPGAPKLSTPTIFFRAQDGSPMVFLGEPDKDMFMQILSKLIGQPIGQDGR